ncbi:MAG: DUF4339 domain-containing protein [Bacteroides sp.]|nr:DUF4339 domain-containing protein [Bacteroides sp.]
MALEGKQAGPFGKEQLKQLALGQQLTRETLVWKQGMAAWEPAGNQGELSDLWTQTPPPLPNA